MEPHRLLTISYECHGAREVLVELVKQARQEQITPVAVSISTRLRAKVNSRDCGCG
jgi:hypothetical protein